VADGEGGLVTVSACCTENGEPSMMSNSSELSSSLRMRRPDEYGVVLGEREEENIEEGVTEAEE